MLARNADDLARAFEHVRWRPVKPPYDLVRLVAEGRIYGEALPFCFGAQLWVLDGLAEGLAQHSEAIGGKFRRRDQRTAERQAIEDELHHLPVLRRRHQ